MRRFARVFLRAGVCGLVLCAGVASFARDWPQWRGPNRDGVATDFKLPDTWPAGPLKPLWRGSLGDGYSAPVIVAGKLYTHDREGEEEYIYCLDAASGKRLWRTGYAAPYKMHDAATGHGPGPKATTTVAGGRVYAFGISSILTCLDAETGQFVWQHNLPVEYEGEPAEYGTAGSPLIEGDLVVVPVGGKRGGSVMAFDKGSGKLVWKAVPGELPSFCSPIAADLAGVRHVLTFTEKQFVGIDAKTGKVLWSHPFETSYRQNTVTPVVVGDLVIASGVGKSGFALRVKREAGQVAIERVWQNSDLRIYMSSPVVVAGHLYALGARNSLVCVNAATGKTAWTHGSFGEYCSIVVAGDRLLVLSNEGHLTVVRADPAAYKELGRSTVSEQPTWSHLALVGSRIYVRNRQELLCFDVAAGRE